MSRNPRAVRREVLEPAYHRPAAWVILSAASLVVAFSARGFFAPHAALGADASSHTAMIATLSERILAGDGWWSTDYNGGFPFVLYYQPIPHVVSALLCAALGGSAHAIFVYKLLSTLMLLLQPWAIYYGARRMGASRLPAATAGACAPLVINGLGFGYTALASLNIGLYTQNWANVVLPLAVGELASLATPQRRPGAAIAATALLAGCHMFYAIAVIPPVLALTLFGEERRRDVIRLAAVGAGALVALSPWLLPLFLNQSFFGGWPFDREERVVGYGWTGMLDNLRTGAWMDGGSWPLLTLLAGVGVVVAVPSWRRERYARAILILAAWSFLGAVGRKGLGALIDVYPLNRNVQLFRYVALFQFAGLLAVGYGCCAIGARLSRWWKPAGIAFVAVCLVAAAPAGLRQLRQGFRLLPDSKELVLGDYYEAAGWVRAAPRGGRLFVGASTGLSGHYHLSLLALLGGRPVGQSPGGLHDSLNFYTLQYVTPDHPNFGALAELFDFRLLLARADPTWLPPGKELRRNATYVLTELPGVHETVAILRVGARLRGTPREARNAIREWMNGNGPATGTSVILDIPTARSRAGLLDAPRQVTGRKDFSFQAPVRGEVLRSEQQGGHFSATVRLDEPAVVAAKISYHPFWRVRVDGVERNAVFVFPGFVGVELSPGQHEIEGAFRWPAYSRWLMVLAPLPFVVAWRVARSRVA